MCHPQVHFPARQVIFHSHLPKVVNKVKIKSKLRLAQNKQILMSELLVQRSSWNSFISSPVYINPCIQRLSRIYCLLYYHCCNIQYYGLKLFGLSRDPYSFFLKVVSRASIPKNMLALAKFWLPFQKWRIIGKKRRQNGYMLKNLCVFVGRQAAVPPFHILLVFCQLHFFFSWLEAPIRHPNIATLFSRSAVKPRFRV